MPRASSPSTATPRGSISRAELGADDTIDAGDDPVVDAVMDLLPQGADCVLDTTATLPVMRQALDVLAPRGRCGFVAAPWDGSELPISVRHLMEGRRIHGIIQGNSNPDIFIPMLVDLYLRGRFPFDRLVKFYPFDDIATPRDPRQRNRSHGQTRPCAWARRVTPAQSVSSPK